MKRLPNFSTDDPDLKALVGGLNRLMEAILERTPLRGAECPIDFFGNGFRIKPTPGRGTGGGTRITASPLSMVFRGEWHSTLDYNVNDVVKVIGGTNAGTYVCVEIAVSGDPEPGTSGAVMWVKIGSDPDASLFR